MYDKVAFENAQQIIRNMKNDPEYKKVQENLDKNALKVFKDLTACNSNADVLDILNRARRLVNQEVQKNQDDQDLTGE